MNLFLNEDCLEGMSKLKDKSIDLIYADLPFGRTQNPYDILIDFGKLWEQYLRISNDKTPIVLHCDEIFAARLILSNEKMFKYTWVWDKKRGVGHLNAKKMPLRRHELIAVFCKTTPNYYPQMVTRGKPRKKGGYAGGNKGNYNHNVEPESFNNTYYPTSILEFGNCNQGAKLHPNQKPLDLCKYIIETYSQPEQTVLDNCAGSASSLIAAAQLNRQYIGFEWQPVEPHDYFFNLAKQRLDSEIGNQQLP